MASRWPLISELRCSLSVMLCTVRLSKQESSVSLQFFTAEYALFFKCKTALVFSLRICLPLFCFTYTFSMWSISAFFFLFLIENVHITGSIFETLFPHSAFRFYWWVIFNFLPPMPPQAEALSAHPTVWNSVHQPSAFPSSHKGVPDHHGHNTEGSEAPG